MTEDDYINYLAQTEIAAAVPVFARGAASAEPLPLPRLQRWLTGTSESSCIGSGAISPSATTRGPSRPERRRPSSGSSGTGATSTCSSCPSSDVRRRLSAAHAGVETAGGHECDARGSLRAADAVQGFGAVRRVRARHAPLLRPRARNRGDRGQPRGLATHGLVPGRAAWERLRFSAPASSHGSDGTRAARAWSVHAGLGAAGAGAKACFGRSRRRHGASRPDVDLDVRGRSLAEAMAGLGRHDRRRALRGP